MSGNHDFEHHLKTSAKLMAKTQALAAISFVEHQSKIRLVYYAQKLESDRQNRHAQRMESALNQVIVHVVLSIATLGISAAVEAVMAGAYAAEGAYATTTGIRYARAAAALEEALAAEKILEKAVKIAQIAKNPALRNILVEYKIVEFMVKAPTFGIQKALEEWAKQKQGKAYEFEVPGAPSKDKGTFFKDEKGELRNPGMDFLKLTKQIYDCWEANKSSEEVFLKKISSIVSNAYKTTLSQELGTLSQENRSLLSLDRQGFSKLDSKLESTIGQEIQANNSGLKGNQLTLATATVLRSYWSGPFNAYSQQKTKLRIEIQALSQELERQKKRIIQSIDTQQKLAENRRPAIRSGDAPQILKPGEVR